MHKCENTHRHTQTHPFNHPQSCNTFFKYSQWGQIFILWKWIFRFGNNSKVIRSSVYRRHNRLSDGGSRLQKVWMYIMWQVHWLGVGVRDTVSLKVYFGSQWIYWNKQMTTKKMTLTVKIYFCVQIPHFIPKWNSLILFSFFLKSLSNKYTHLHSHIHSHSNFSQLFITQVPCFL